MDTTFLLFVEAFGSDTKDALFLGLLVLDLDRKGIVSYAGVGTLVLALVVGRY